MPQSGPIDFSWSVEFWDDLLDVSEVVVVFVGGHCCLFLLKGDFSLFLQPKSSENQRKSKIHSGKLVPITSDGTVLGRYALCWSSCGRRFGMLSGKGYSLSISCGGSTYVSSKLLLLSKVSFYE